MFDNHFLPSDIHNIKAFVLVVRTGYFWYVDNNIEEYACFIKANDFLGISENIALL